MEKKITYIAQEKDAGRCLENILKKDMGLTAKEISRAKFREHGICVNGERKKVKDRVTPGDTIEVLLETKEEVSEHLVAQAGALCILYEDKDVIVLDKPAGLVEHPTGAHYADTLANRLAAYLREKREDSVIRIVGRLDKETSGVVLAVKNRAAALRLERQRESGMFSKTYLAVTEGIPEPHAGWIRTPIGPEPERKGKMRTYPEALETVNRDGQCSAVKKASTHYEVLKTKDGRALVRLQLETGRTHQIRVHMASLGCPLAGDPLYGNSAEQRMLLHALRLRFLQPFSGKECLIETQIPKEFASYFT